MGGKRQINYQFIPTWDELVVYLSFSSHNIYIYTYIYIYIYREREREREIGKQEETIFSSLQACFVITHSSGDFVKNNRNHRLYTLQICIIGVAENLNALFNCYAVTLCFCGGMRTILL